MKKTHDTNIGGTVFHVEDAAYDQLDQYINSIKRYFAAYPDHAEILADIEGRIAEQLLQVTPQRVVTVDNVQHVITVMGRVEQFGDNGGEGAAAPSISPGISVGDGVEARGRSKRFFRDRDEKVIAGVAGGLAAYFGQSPLLIRLLFLASLFIGGSGIFVYVILWICVPYARTTTDKLRMHGEQVTLAKIDQGIRERVNAIHISQRQRVRRFLPFGIAAFVILLICIGCLFTYVRFFSDASQFTENCYFGTDEGFGTDDQQSPAVRRVDTVVAVQGTPTVDLSIVTGEIQVMTGTRPEVKVQASTDSNGRLEFKASDTNIQLKERRKNGICINHGAKYVVIVPQGTSVVTKSMSGKQSITGTNGEVHAEAVSGDIDIRQAKHVVVKNMSGGISLANISAGVQGETVSGDWHAEGVNGDINAHTMNGDLIMEGARSRHAILRSVSGTIQYTGIPDSSSTYEFNNLSGDVIVNIPATARPHVVAKSMSGTVHNDFSNGSPSSSGVQMDITVESTGDIWVNKK